MEEKAKTVIDYHERSKHHPHRYAEAPPFLDWANEPDPFRRYEGTSLLHLPLLEKDPDANYARLYEREAAAAQPFTLGNIAAFLELSMGISAWKSLGTNSWALRMNPSSGNLHPTETHLVLPPTSENNGLGGIFHYNPFSHALEQRASFDRRFWMEIKGHFGAEGFLVGLSSIYWRESWKYGERGFRYCNHDVGHALACLSFAGSILGWRATCLGGLADEEIETVLGFDHVRWKKFEREQPEILLFISAPSEKNVPRDMPAGLVASFRSLSFTGDPNRLSNAHRDWRVIDEASSAAEKPKTAGKRYGYGTRPFIEREIPTRAAAAIIRGRRSALAYDRRASVPKNVFFGMLDRTVPRSGCAPFDAGAGELSVDLLLFVHRVSGLEPGLYFLVRDERSLDDLRQRCDSAFLWERAADPPEALPLYLLRIGDCREQAERVSCHQEIAGDGVFAVAMIARFRENVAERPFLYRCLHWEAGMIGQVFYLEAEAHELRGTGMGCFFDDPVHEILGLRDNVYQDIYHFAVGKAVEDRRLTTLPPYHHLKGERNE